MAIATIADTIQRNLWKSDMFLQGGVITNLITSGILTTDLEVSKLVNAKDSSGNILIPYVKADTFVEGSYGTGAGAADIISTGYEKAEAKANVCFPNRAFGYYNILDKVGSGVNSLDIFKKFGMDWFDAELTKRLIAQLKGAVAAVKADNASDMIISTDAVISYNLVVDVKALFGDAESDVEFMVVNSAILAALRKADAASVSTILDSQLGFLAYNYNGMTLLVNDEACPLDAVSGRYTTIFLKKGAFVFAPASVAKPVAYVIDEKADGGAGKEEIVFRNGYLLTLNGFTFTAANVAGLSATLAECADATNWERYVEGKYSPFAILECKAA